MRSPSTKGSKRFSRRAFLGRGGLLLGGLAMFAGWGESGVAATPKPRVVKPIDLLPWDSLRQEISGKVLRPGESGYAAAAAPWNPRYADLLPGGIAQCRSAADVQKALFWAQSNRIPLAIRSGGHCLAGHSNTRGLMIDLSLMRGVDLSDDGILRIDGGARVSDLVPVLKSAGRALTLGRCPNLGMAGLILGGGLGLAMRRHGLTCDQLLETELVTSDGRLLVCDRLGNEDFFWACRGGGGGNFGVNTSFTLKTFPVGDLTVFTITWTRDLVDVLPTLLSILPGAPDSLGCELSVKVTAGGAARLELLGQMMGTVEEVQSVLDPAYQIARPEQETVESLPYWDGQERLAERGAREMMQVRSRYAYADLPPQATDLILDSLKQWPGTAGSATWRAYLTGGMVDTINRRGTAYVHRGASMLTSIALTWRSTDSQQRLSANLSWLEGFHLAMQPYTSTESSQNFRDPSLDDHGQAYYAENLTYLTSLKRKLDPDRAFLFAQAVPHDSQL